MSKDAAFSLAMNSKLICPPTEPPRFSIRFDAIQRPARTVAFLDARVNTLEPKEVPERRLGFGQPDSWLGQPGAYASRFAPRHGTGGNLAFCDGHAAWRPGTQVVETNFGRAIFPGGEILWCADPARDPNE